jgi:tetratricopeptide (TPR) repeat protein
MAMSTSNSSPNKDQQSESLEERVSMLFEELALAVKWQRPSILLAIYASEFVCSEAQLMLEKKLTELGQNISRLTVTAKRPDIPMFLSKYPERYKTIFFVKGLQPETEQGGYPAYRALNIRRELLVDYRIRVVFWITEKEAADLPVHAPDFWAFRHRVIEFLDVPEPERMAALARSLTLDGNSDEMVKAFKKALKLDPRNVNLLSSLGDIYIKLNKANEAIQMFRKAIKLDTKNANLWVRLGDIYRSVDRIDDARKAYTAAIALEPNNRNAQSSLASCNRISE